MATQRTEEIMEMVQEYARQVIRTQFYIELVKPSEHDKQELEKHLLLRKAQFDNIREAIIDLTWSVKE